MNIDIYQAITVKTEYGFDEPDDPVTQDTPEYTVVYFGDTEVHRSKSQNTGYSYTYDSDELREREYDRAVGEFGARLVAAMDGSALAAAMKQQAEGIRYGG